MNIEQYTIWDILLARKRGFKYWYHPIIFIEWSSMETFIWCMLTHSNTKADNIKLEDHFFEIKPKGEKDSYFVKIKLIKPKDWGPFKLYWKLNKDWINFISSFIKELEPITWDDYIS